MDSETQVSNTADISRCDHATLSIEQTSSPGDWADSLPDYLVRYYRWAYLWPVAVWFFDHQPIINAILFGNYRKIMDHTMRMMQTHSAGKTLQIASVYGELIPRLAAAIDELHVIDIAPVQLQAVNRKLEAVGQAACVTRMNAEHIEYQDDFFDSALMFLLLHEMPPAARRRSLREALRVIRPGGRFVVAEYGEFGRRHVLHRFLPMRWVLTTVEPFLGGFWQENLDQLLRDSAAAAGKQIELEEQVSIFGGFYRVLSYRLQ